MQVISNLTMITMILTGAALIREREQGTVEHLLVMPVVPMEIMLAEDSGQRPFILVAAEPVAAVRGTSGGCRCQSPDRFCCLWRGSSFYVFTVASLGILLGTIAATMAQFGLLSIPVLLVMMLLSGCTTPMESMPVGCNTS